MNIIIFDVSTNILHTIIHEFGYITHGYKILNIFQYENRRIINCITLIYY